VDRNVQQFADEPVLFADEANPLDIPLLPPPGRYHARWNEPAPPPARRLVVILASLAVVSALGVFALVFGPRSLDDLTVRSDATARSASPSPTAPAVSRIEPPRPQQAAEPAPPPTDVRSAPAPAVAPPEPRAAVRDSAREAPDTAATTGRTARNEPPISTRGVVERPTTPPTPSGPLTAQPPPSLAIATPALTAHVGTDTVTPDLKVGPTTPVLGQPIGPPREVTLNAEARDVRPTPGDEPPRAAATPAPAPSAPVADPRAFDRDRVRAVLAGYERAYSSLDANAAARVFPGIDRKALTRAFSGLSAQEIQFDDCRIQILQATAQATCAGTSRWTPKVGGGSRQQSLRWQFDLQQSPAGWRIGSVKVQ